MIGIVFCVAMASCHRGTVVSEEVLEDFLTEAYMIEGFYAIETGNHSETVTEETQAAYAALLDKYGMTSDDFERSIDYYMHHAEQYAEIHQRVIERLDEQSAAASGVADKE